MKRSGFCVLLAALFLLSGCDGRSEPEKQAAEPPAAQSGSVGPAPYAETAPAYGLAEEDDNPYASYVDSGGMYLSWLYDVYEAYRGADGETRIETRNRQWLEYHIDLSALDDGAGYWHSNEIKLPQFSGADPFAAGVNRHYREVYDRLLKEEWAYQEEYAAWDGSSYIDRFGTGLIMKDEYLWNGFYQVILTRPDIGSRVFYAPVIETFDAETGEMLGLEDLFAGEEEVWVPALAELLAEEGLSRAAGNGEGFERIADSENLFFGFAVAEEMGAESFQSFMLTPNGLGFAFPVGLTAAMCVGEVIVLVPYEKAAGLLKPEILERVVE